MLKLMRLPQGTHRSRLMRRPGEILEEEVDFAEVERLFRRFWREYRQPGMTARREGNPACG